MRQPLFLYQFSHTIFQHDRKEKACFLMDIMLKNCMALYLSKMKQSEIELMAELLHPLFHIDNLNCL